MFRRLLLTLVCVMFLATTALPALGQERDHGVRLVAFGSEEMAFIRLPGGKFVWPKSEVLGGDRPRIILDFPGINGWDEAYLPTGGGTSFAASGPSCMLMKNAYGLCWISRDRHSAMPSA
ncbi:hypothetical protein [Desulfovibrio ferrophilus]|uniref:Uncharacterized protein n=1 Tax=Desulfovibrio ferrophilus TaxID=241368 RepID=A0A2Z6AVK0_9BACT|nr:hypothetical protein [Desulfovibrio ferrophilus]BBD07243.1 putative uncharacterized protein [Desulfovibrio ferrophilus]